MIFNIAIWYVQGNHKLFTLVKYKLGVSKLGVKSQLSVLKYNFGYQ